MHRLPLPLLTSAIKPQRRCSVCGNVSYSPGGIHPQCSQKQADDLRVESLKSAKKAEHPKEKVANPDAFNPWRNKLCPKCHTHLYVRKLTCDCGHPAGQKPIGGKLKGEELRRASFTRI